VSKLTLLLGLQLRLELLAQLWIEVQQFHLLHLLQGALLLLEGGVHEGIIESAQERGLLLLEQVVRPIA